MPTMAMSPEGAAVLVVPDIFKDGRGKFRDDFVKTFSMNTFTMVKLRFRAGFVFYRF